MQSEPITLEKLYAFLQMQFKSIDQRFEGIDQRLESMDRRLDTVEHRLDAIEHRLGILEGQMSIMQSQMEYINNRLIRLEEKFDQFQKDDKKSSRTFSKWILIGNSLLSATISFFTTIFTVHKIN